ncbi:hypothetical protein CLIB1444_12S02366 [[Candida] jaroonii]|uniref:Uncharacterized protein n=1 Tax=[Candida] jaroonii TaxID=467808 RepID=A0ACA9YDL3_9ASCO|nr:hypothetical protein CLIB1444_12S02366 [[Candida] jaroonii]
MPYLNKESVVGASKTLNDILISKGYIDEPLLFPTIDFDQLKTGQSQEFPELQVTEKIYNNDKNIINIIHGLIQSVDRNKDQNTTFNKILTRKDETIKDLQAKNLLLQKEINKNLKHIQQQQNEIEILNNRKFELTSRNNLMMKNISRFKQKFKDLEIKYEIEIKRQLIEIDTLKNQLINKKNLSTSITYGIKTKRLKTDFTPNTIIGNNPIINNTFTEDIVTPQLNIEYEDMINHLSSLVDNLLRENHKLTKFMKSMTSYFSNLNNNLYQFQNNPNIVISNPSDFISNTDDDIEIDIKDVEGYDTVVTPFLNNIYKNYHHLKDVIDGFNNIEDPDVENLKNELNIVTKNWEDAMKTLEDWKSRRK